ncbi:hypothetical protein CLV84_4340 [Neolewinella xylanilytica]|uniref:Uncharacterized protein n=1 Tax=Neolewinella xylanilytica TaxID=1514080 RepID=A0A2S6HZX8_9BACT|nr:hypothetical protein [Neolewinella xylanilytica]PPK83794.1 hypothetical protein CLV84_4340 [Neolewinella xylanilytica]
MEDRNINGRGKNANLSVLISTILTTFIMSSIILPVDCIAQNVPGINLKTFVGSRPDLEKGEDDNYHTANWYLYSLQLKKVEELQATIDKINEDISKETDIDKIPVHVKKLEAEEQKHSEAVSTSQDYYIEYVKDYLEYDNWVMVFGQARSRALFEIIYNDDSENRFNLLTNTGLNIGQSTGSVYSELVSGQLSAFRIGLGVMVASTNAEEENAQEQEAFQRLSTYGGNTVLSFDYPLIYGHLPKNQGVLLTRFILKGNADFPEFGTTSDKWAGSVSYGLDVYADISTSNNAIRFFGNINMSKYHGSGQFRDNLGVNNTDFSFGQLKVGLMFNNVSLSFVVSTFSSEEGLRNRNVIAGGQIVN